MYWIKKYFTDPREHRKALLEVFVTAIVSLIPLICAPLIESSRHIDTSLPGLGEMLGKGQLFVLTYGVFGTVFWLAFVRSFRTIHGARVALGLISLFLIAPIFLLLSEDPSLTSVVNPIYLKASYWLFILMNVIYYLLIFYTNISPPETQDIFDREASEMRTRYEELRREH